MASTQLPDLTGKSVQSGPILFSEQEQAEGQTSLNIKTKCKETTKADIKNFTDINMYEREEDIEIVWKEAQSLGLCDFAHRYAFVLIRLSSPKVQEKLTTLCLTRFKSLFSSSTSSTSSTSSSLEEIEEREEAGANLRQYLENSSVLNSCMKEWRLIHYDASSFKTVYEPKVSCVCGHKLSRAYFLCNTQTQNIIRVGSACLRKYDSEAQDNFDMIHKFHEGSSEVRRQCQACGLYKINRTEPKWKDRCLNCFKQKREVNPILKELYETVVPTGHIPKTCQDCGKQFHIDPKENWKVQCLPCYRIKPNKASYIKVECENCSVSFSRKEEDTWRKICFKCYKLRQEHGGGRVPVTSSTPSSNLRECVKCGAEFDISGGYKHKVECQACELGF